MAELLFGWMSESWALWLDLSPYLLLGFVLAGFLHGVLGENLIRRHFASSRFSSVFKATLLGIPLPICSCGVVPLAESLRRDGASKPATLAFLISTPTSGVDSILATYGLMGPFFALIRPLAGLLAGLGVGVLARVAEPSEEPVSSLSLPNDAPKSPRRKGGRALRDVLDYGLGQLPRDTGKWLIVGTLAGGMISALIPEGFVSSQLQSPLLQYLAVLMLSVPLYVCATGSIPLAVGLMGSGVLPGAALVLLIAGPATNTVTLTFIFKRLGKRVGLVYLGSLIGVAILLGLMTDALFASGSGLFRPEHMHVHEEGIGWFSFVSALFMLSLILWRIVPWKGLVRTIRSVQKGQPAAAILSVPDMTCTVCERKIRDHLKGIPGLETVKVELDQKALSFQDEALRQKLSSELKNLGYHPEEN